MNTLPKAIINVFNIFTPLFSRPVYKNVLQLFGAHILSKGRRTVADLLRILNLSHIKNYSKFHWALSGANWSGLQGAKLLFQRLIQLVATDEIFITIDSTIERRKGEKIKSLGRYRDATQSSKANKVLCIGLHWLVCAINISFPFTSRSWALPFLSILMPPQQPLRSSKNTKDLNRKSRYKKMTEWACQVAYIVRRWVGKNRKITIVGDNAFACFKLAYACLFNDISLISRLRLDARLFDPPPPEQMGRGRKRVAGKCLPKLTELACRDISAWQEIDVKWYHNATKKVLIQSGKCLWYYIGFKPIAIHWILIKQTPNSTPVALFSTNLNHTPIQIIEAFVGRWSLEVTFEEARRHLGMETQRQWADKAIDRVTPVILASFSIMTLMGLELLKETQSAIKSQWTSWYQKKYITFSDILAALREAILRGKHYSILEEIGDQRIVDIENLILLMAVA